ncbi:MAG: acyl-CoA dehydrogenase family protein [SAR86 cluster bacterium]|jgi:acyl-CoA dehydrogenase|uniref:Acyl-CoA/acyl-ACP dehydrogenase n=1 Tax=SAR86 cluster bacterium TaxID=2030880 RepID=A0A973A9W2_9GAMM|nr:acyl-CoA/acyl-ACP dehydrogenase [SAR86 cluster bacterium]|tara:strand:- start:10325 stop:11449 length:1125 start_codon:yes stop_codon:yes gene_type:complete
MSQPIEFTEEQSMLLDTAMDFCGKHSPVSLVRARLGDEQTIPAAVWQEIVDLGWSAITIPETYGGLGLGLSELVPVVESMGRHLMATPLVWSAAAAHTLLLAGSEEQKNIWLPKLATGAVATMGLVELDGSWLLDAPTCGAEQQTGKLVLTGTKCFVQDATLADMIIVSVLLAGQPRLVLLDKAQIPVAALTQEVVIDETRRSFQLDLDGISVGLESLLPQTCFAEIEQVLMLLLSAEMVGGHANTLNLVIEYLKTRKQFDKYIGSYQALKHPTVDILIGLEASRSHVYHGATVFDQADSSSADKAIALRMAKAVASEGFAFAGDRAIQFHGGFGFTFECDAQLYLRRALWCQYQFGDETYQRSCLAPLLLDRA